MKIHRLKNIVKVSFVTLLLLIPSMIAIQASLPKPVSAAACTGTSGGGGGGYSLLSLGASLASVDSSVEKITAEFTPAQTWQDGSSSIHTGFRFAKNDCTSAGASLYLTLNGKSLSISYYDVGRTGSFVSGTDYKNLASGVTVPSASGTGMTADYTTGTVATSAAQQLSVDLGTDAGFANIYLKQGSGSETLLISIKLPTNTTSFLVVNGYTSGVSYSESSFSGESCTEITGAGEIAVRMLLDGTAAALSAEANTSATCGNFDETSYDSGTKTATLRYDTTDKDPNHVIIGQDSFKTASDDSGSFYTSLDTAADGDNYYLTDSFVSSNATSENITYAVTNYQEGRSTPQYVPYPVVAGTVDFSTNDLSLSEADVSLDVSAANYAAFAHNFNTITKDGSFTLFAAQREGDEYVGVCPGAQEIASVTTTCSDLYFLKDGETKNGATASIITVGATKFWQVSGLTGTGVFSSTVGVIPGSPSAGDSKGFKTAYITMAGIGGLFILTKTRGFIIARKRK